MNLRLPRVAVAVLAAVLAALSLGSAAASAGLADDSDLPERLQATSAAAGPDGDRLAHTTYIQRINTVGGLEPAAAECTAESLGSQREIPYTADYRFWKEQSQ